MPTEINGRKVFGAIEEKWLSVGGAHGFLGSPISNEMPTFDGLGRFQNFQGGIISWHPDSWAHIVQGSIKELWLQIGREQFGYPITDELPTPNGRGRFNHFRSYNRDRTVIGDNSIYWIPETGAHAIHGAIRDKWAEMGWENSFLGFPVSNESATPNGKGAYSHFQGGSIYWSPETGAHAIHGAIRDKWAEMGWENSVLGFPVSDELVTPDGNGAFSHFQDGSIYWSPETGAHAIHGANRDKWAEMGWENSVLGFPVSDESATPNGQGAFCHFQGGSIYWSPETSVHVIHGAIRDKWAEMGWENSFLGFPVNDESATPDGKGAFSHFQGGSIYWSPETDAHEIYGAIRDKWANTGWEMGPLGFPKSAEASSLDGSRIQFFEFGVISWRADRGARIDWVSKKDIVVTPSGTALGGWAEIEIHWNGDFVFRGHMHDSGATGYNFHVLLTLDDPKLGFVFVVQKSGSVEGALDGFSPERDFDWEERGNNPIIQSAWEGITFSRVHVSKTYEWSGTIGSPLEIVKDAMSYVVGSNILGPHVAALILLSSELSKESDTRLFGVGGVPGVLAMAGWSFFMGPGFAIPVFIGAAVVTTLLFKQKVMTEKEYNFAKLVFGDTLPSRERIIFTNISGLGGVPFVVPNSDGTFLVNLGEEVFEKGPLKATIKNYPVEGQVLIHELVHVWQLSRPAWRPWFMCKAVTNQIMKDDDTYNRPSNTQVSWNSLNPESQGAVVDKWFQTYATGWIDLRHLELLLTSRKALQDPYFHYIAENIRLGKN